MKIRMKKATRWNEQQLAAGAVVEVDDRIASRWISNGIAEAYDAPDQPDADAQGPNEDGADSAGANGADETDENLEALKQKELIEVAAKKGITFKPGTTKKQLIGLIRKFEGRISGE